MKIRLSSQAKADLADIRRYIENDNPHAAAELIRSLRDSLRHTDRPIPVDGDVVRRPGSRARCFPVGNYVLFYLVGTSVDVVRVLHGAREIEAIFPRLRK